MQDSVTVFEISNLLATDSVIIRSPEKTFILATATQQQHLVQHNYDARTLWKSVRKVMQKTTVTNICLMKHLFLHSILQILVCNLLIIKTKQQAIS